MTKQATYQTYKGHKIRTNYCQYTNRAKLHIVLTSYGTESFDTLKRAKDFINIIVGDPTEYDKLRALASEAKPLDVRGW